MSRGYIDVDLAGFRARVRIDSWPGVWSAHAPQDPVGFEVTHITDLVTGVEVGDAYVMRQTGWDEREYAEELHHAVVQEVLERERVKAQEAEALRAEMIQVEQWGEKG